tara:strand:- start:735 stop:1067 length:333 start_codon:yes stop_codon:yes gene_type:complete
MNYEKINNEIKKFVEERDWDQFHSPKNLSMALSVEASELVEIYQWQKEDDYKTDDVKIKDAVKDELVDIFFYLMRMCHKTNIDLEKSFYEKMEKNRKKYPIEKYKGKSKI